MFELIKHSLGMRTTQSIATLVTVALTVAVLMALALTSIGVTQGIQKSQQRYGADLMVIPADAASSLDETSFLFTGSPVGMYMSASVQDQVAATEGVGTTTAQFFGQTLNASCCSASSPSRLIGYDAQSDWVISPWTDLAKGQKLEEGQIIVGSNLAGDFPNKQGKVLGHPVTVASVMDQTGTDLDGSILMDIDTVRAYTAATDTFADTWERYGDPSTLVSSVMVKVDDSYVAGTCGGSREDAIAAVAEHLSHIDGVSVIQSSKVIDQVQGNLTSMFTIMAGAALLLAIASIVQIFTRFYTVAWDRRAEIALYRAVGASKQDIRTLIGGEAAVLIGGGLLVGCVLGVGIYLLVPSLLASSGSFPYLAPGPLAWVGVILGLVILFAVVGMLAVIVPVRRANRIDPSAAMQMGDID
jgi:putative ABC transport system permease protein